MSDNPAVFETEPRENTELDVYYEASNAIPLRLDDNTVGNIDNKKGHIIAPVGTSVWSSSNTTWSIDPLYAKVKDWDGDIVEINPGLLTKVSLDNTDITTESAQWKGAPVSYTHLRAHET